MSTIPARQPKGIPSGGQFSGTEHSESALSLAEIAWAREVTGTTAAEGSRYYEVMDRVFAAASAPHLPEDPSPALRIPSQLVFKSPVQAHTVRENMPGTITGGADRSGFYAFQPDDGSNAYSITLHDVLVTDPALRPTTEHRAAEFTIFASEHDEMRRMHWNNSAATQASAAAGSARALVTSLDGSEEPLAPGVRAALEDVRSALRDQVPGSSRHSPEAAAGNVRALEAGQRLVKALGFLQPDWDEI